MYINRNHQNQDSLTRPMLKVHMDPNIINSNIATNSNFVSRPILNNFKDLSKQNIENISDDMQIDCPYY